MKGELDMVRKMMELARKWHAGQFREAPEGEIPPPYIVHPAAVVKNLLDWGEPEDSEAAAIAWGHDLLEDTKVPEAEILAASSETVLSGIRQLTRNEETEKRQYLLNVAQNGTRDILLVKISDRIDNACGFVRLSGPLRAFRYLHDADCIFEAVRKYSSDPVLKKAAAAWDRLDKRLRESARRDAIRGCLLGGAVGDALGAVEESIHRRQHSITAYTQLTLFTAEGILRANTRNRERGICDPVAVMRYAYLRWLKTQNGALPENDFPEALDSGWLIQEKELYVRRAPEAALISALENSREGEMVCNHIKDSGAVVRMAPAGLFFEPEMAYDYGCRFAELTHCHSVAAASAGAFAMLIAEILSGKTLEEALDQVMTYLEDYLIAWEAFAALKKARTTENISEFEDCQSAAEVLAAGVFCALKHPWDYSKGVLLALDLGGPGSSAGSVAGSIIGVINGRSAIPAQWLFGLREWRIVSRIADDLWKRFEDDSEDHVTEKWWNAYPGF
jgi:ADP-ribosylglycohydrolase